MIRQDLQGLITQKSVADESFVFTPSNLDLKRIRILWSEYLQWKRHWAKLCLEHAWLLENEQVRNQFQQKQAAILADWSCIFTL